MNSKAEIQSTESKGPDGKKKFRFADLFKDEGMYHSVNEAYIIKNQVGKDKNAGLLRTEH